MAAAMQLARARRRVLVVDAGLRRNRFAVASHGFFGQDGNSPAAIAAVAKAQLLRYPNVAWHEGSVLQASRQCLAGGRRWCAGRGGHAPIADVWLGQCSQCRTVKIVQFAAAAFTDLEHPIRVCEQGAANGNQVELFAFQAAQQFV